MYVKKNFMLWLAVFAMALPLLFVGTASAKYQSDGAVPDSSPTGTAGFITPSDGICVTGLHADGTMDYVAHSTIDSKRGCIYYNTGLTGMTMADVTSSITVTPKTLLTTYGACVGGATKYTWDFVNSRCLDTSACSGTSATTRGTLTWNTGDSKCYDSAACTVVGATGNDGAKHALATSICVDGSGNGISLKDMDRTFAMCAAKGGTWKAMTDGIVTNGTDTLTVNSVQVHATPGFGGACVAYGWQYRYQDASGTPLTFGAHGVSQGGKGTGFCYTSIATGITPSTLCPSKSSNLNTKYGYSTLGTGATTSCLYTYGTAGVNSAKLTNIDNTTYAAAFTTVDLTGLTQGECIAHGASWTPGWGFVNTGVDAATADSWVTANSHGIKFDQQLQALNADEGCLHCHSSKDQANGPAERQKDSYLKTGHKNMLRKVVAGQNLVGPDGVVYATSNGTDVLNFTNATVTSGATVSTLTYIYGDWMIAAPTIAYPGAGYSCGGCHTTGYQDSTNPGVQSIGWAGNPVYTAAEPAASGANYVASVAAGNKWDLEGITCGRCHNATVPSVSQTQISGGTCKNGTTDVTSFYPTLAQCTTAGYTWTASGTASAFPSTAPTGGGMGALSSGTGRFNLCFGCHGGGSMAKAYPAGTTQYDPTLVGTGGSHGAAAGREFNGHILGQSFLTSPHARYAGANSTTANGGTRLNSLGKYDLFDPNGTSEYNSLFKGYTCWQSPTTNSPAKTKADGTEIKTKSECEALYGAGSWRADQDGSLAATSVQGTCTTCHDVHNSLFVAGQAEAAIRKTCEDCHVNNATTGATDAASPQIGTDPITHNVKVNHPTGTNTPFDTLKYESACVVCHMATQAEANGNQNSMPAHLWRINTDASYNTFPTTSQFYGGLCSKHTGTVQNKPLLPVVYQSDISSAECVTPGVNGTWTTVTKDRNAQTAPDGAYAKAVWVDLDLACGQCHGGSFGAGYTANAAPYIDKVSLSQAAANMHQDTPGAHFAMKNSPNVNYRVQVDGSMSTCPTTTDTCTDSNFAWDFGDNTTVVSGITAAHNYADATPRNITLTVTAGGVSSSKSKSITPTYVAQIGTITSVSGLTVPTTGFHATANWTVANGVAPYKVQVSYGNGTVMNLTQPAAGAGTWSWDYVSAGTYTVKVMATDSGNGSGGNITTGVAKTSVPIAASASTVSGLVTTSTGTPIPISGAAVTLKNLNGVVKYLTYTNASCCTGSGTGTCTVNNGGIITVDNSTCTAAAGAYLFSGVAPKDYTLRAANGLVKSAIVPITVNAGSNPQSTITIP